MKQITVMHTVNLVIVVNDDFDESQLEKDCIVDASYGYLDAEIIETDVTESKVISTVDC